MEIKDSLSMESAGLLRVQNKQQITIAEPELQGVKQEDRTTVRNVIYLLHTCKHPARLCVSWSVTNSRSGDGYEVTGFLEPGKDFEILTEDLDYIAQADPLRVGPIAITRTGEATRIVIRVLCKSEPVMMTELEVLTVHKKKRRLWSER